MTTNELMRHLLTDLPDADRRHLVDVVDRNHADQLARKRRAPVGPGDVIDPFTEESDDVD